MVADKLRIKIEYTELEPSIKCTAKISYWQISTCAADCRCIRGTKEAFVKKKYECNLI